MKKALLIFSVAAVAAAFFAFSPADPETLSIGAKAPKTDLKMTDISGGKISLADVKKANGLLVVFSCNTCPFVVGSEGSEGWDGRYAELQAVCDKDQVGMILVNSNEAKRDKGDSMDEMKKRAEERGFSKSHYVLDKNSELANAFFARTTPHVYLFDKDMKLVYKGSIDDNVDSPAKVTQPYLKNALNNLTSGAPINPAETKPVGCGIKRVS